MAEVRHLSLDVKEASPHQVHAARRVNDNGRSLLLPELHATLHPPHARLRRHHTFNQPFMRSCRRRSQAQLQDRHERTRSRGREDLLGFTLLTPEFRLCLDFSIH